MQHRTIEVDVHEIEDRLLVIKSDDLDQSDLNSMREALKQKGFKNVAIMCLGLDQDFHSMSQEDAIEILKQLISKRENA